MPVEPGSRPRVLLYSHDGLGLGHLRRTLAIAEAFARRAPNAALLVVTGSAHGLAFPLPATADVVKVPSIEKRWLFASESDRADGPDDVFALREAIIAATTASFAPHLVLVDHEPAGLAGELLPLLSDQRTRPARPKLVVGLRDIADDPAVTRARWRADGVYDLLDRVYDRILIYGSRDLFDPIRAYGLSTAAAAKATFTGYLRRAELVHPAETVRTDLGSGSAPLVVVTTGGGMDGGPLLRAYLTAVRDGRLPGLVSHVVAGPQLPAEELANLKQLASALPGVNLIPFDDDLVSMIATADVVVTMGGYNAVCEAVGSGHRPVVVPRTGGSAEQRMRAERFAARGLVTLLEPAALSPDRLAVLVRSELARGTSPPPLLDFNGLDRVGEVLSALLVAREGV